MTSDIDAYFSINLDRRSFQRKQMTDEPFYIPFSQRTGLKSLPPQLKLGEISAELRRLFVYYLGLEIDRVGRSGYTGYYFTSDWKRVAMDFHVLFLGKDADTYNNSCYEFNEKLKIIIMSGDIGSVFDLVEFFSKHPKCSKELKKDLKGAFMAARAAYRIVDSQIIAIGVEAQGAAFVGALEDAEAMGAGAARTHLVAAGMALRNSDWPGSVRESIHAVEAMARILAPEASSLGPALAALEKKRHLHGSLKAAFGALYGYSSNEAGVRHSLVFYEEAQVDEADALFMLGACASFVSYLLARSS